VTLTARLWSAAGLAAAAAWALRPVITPTHPVLAALLLLSVYGGVYFLITDRLGIPEAAAVIRRLRPRDPRSGAAG